MKTYDLYLESGKQHKKTLLHALGLLGCVVQGATTDEALELAPDAIRAYLSILKRAGEPVDPKAPFKTRVARHVIGPASAIGMDSARITFGPDLKSVTPRDIETSIARLHAMRETLASWAQSQTEEQLDAVPEPGGRPARKVILHMMYPGYLGALPDMSAVLTSAERGETPLAGALRRFDAAVATALRATTPARRRQVIQTSPERTRTLRKAIRRTLEHDWEHLYELSRRPGGPEL